MFMHFEGDGRLQIGSGLIHEETGLGSVLKTVFSRIGLPACGGCDRRADWLDQHVRLVPGSPREIQRHPFED
jgi:hypothetical protein